MLADDPAVCSRRFPIAFAVIPIRRLPRRSDCAGELVTCSNHLEPSLAGGDQPLWAGRPFERLRLLFVNAEVKFPRSAEAALPTFWLFGDEPIQSSVRVSFLERPRFFGGGGVMNAFARTCSGMRTACFPGL